MAFTGALFTSLAVWGAPGPASAPLAETTSVTDTCSVSVTDTSSLIAFVEIAGSDTLSVTLSGETSALFTTDFHLDKTELRPYGGPGPYHEIGDKTAVTIAELDVTDTLSVQWLEEPVDEQGVDVNDTLRVSLGEVGTLHNRIDAVDQLSVSLSETLSLLQTGVTLKTASDTASVTFSAETVTLHISLDVTDTASVTFSDEIATVDTLVEVITASDTLSVTLDEPTPLLEVFTGVLTLAVADELRVLVADTADQEDIVEVTVDRITFKLLQNRIRFEML
jgi:hypothetical protein